MNTLKRNKYLEVGRKLNDLGFLRLRNGTTTPHDEDMELIVQVMDGVLGKDVGFQDDDSGIILKMLGMK